jgi:hypothetical protein
MNEKRVSDHGVTSPSFHYFFWLKKTATSNAPTIGRKRRLSSTDRDPERQASPKKVKSSVEGSTSTRDTSPGQAQETEEVKAVTKGVKDVELEGAQAGPSSRDSESATPPPNNLAVVAEGPEEQTDLSPEQTQITEHTSESVHVLEKDPASVPLPAEDDDPASSDFSTSATEEPAGVDSSEDVHGKCVPAISSDELDPALGVDAGKEETQAAEGSPSE